MKLTINAAPAHNPQWDKLLIKAEEYKDAKKYTLALPLLDDYIAVVPDSTRAYADKAYCLNGSDDFEGALSCADRSIALKPDNVDALSNRAWALNHLGRFQEALETAKTALNVDPTDAESWCDQGEALMGLGDYKSALVALNKHCSLHEGEWYAYDRRAACYDKLGMADLARLDREKLHSL